MIVLDASVLISYSDAQHVFHRRAVDWLRACATQPLRMSAVTLAEIYVGPTRAGRLMVAQQIVADLGIRSVPLVADVPARLARLRVETGLKLPDCCVLLAAQDVEATTVLAFDDRLLRAARAAGYRTDPVPP